MRGQGREDHMTNIREAPNGCDGEMVRGPTDEKRMMGLAKVN